MPAATAAELDAILHGAAVAKLTDRAFLRISGSDAIRWLNGMVTNSIQALASGEGNYNFLLNAQGRIQADCTIYREPGEEVAFLLVTDSSQRRTVQETLDRFIIMDDVELSDRDFERVQQLIGPGIPQVLRSSQSQEVADTLSADRSGLGRLWAGAPEEIAFSSPGDPPLSVTLASNFSNLSHMQTWEDAGALRISAEALEAFRILSGVPRFGIDIRDRDLPQETNQTHALHFSKGCYLGQEIVERIRSRGQVHRLFTRFRLTGVLPTAFPVPLTVDGKAAGELTSAALVPLPAGPEVLALGYGRREFLEAHKDFIYDGGTAVPRSASETLTTHLSEIRTG